MFLICYVVKHVLHVCANELIKPLVTTDCPKAWQPLVVEQFPDSKVHGANMGSTCGRQDPGGPHVGHVNRAIWVGLTKYKTVCTTKVYT